MDKSEKYTGQALIIVLIVLIVGAIIALALAVRSIKSQQKVIEEERSSESYNIASSLISYSQILTAEDITAAFARAECVGQDECCFEGEEIADLTDTTLTESFTCSQLGGGSSGLTEVKFCLDEVQNFNDLEIPKDKTVSIPILSSYGGCSLDFSFTPQGSGTGGIMIKRIYAQKDALGIPIEFKDYSSSDITSLQMGTNTDWDNWQSYTAGTNYPIDISSAGGYDLYEIRLTAVGSSMNVTMADSAACFGDPVYYRVVTSANCSGEFRSLWYYKPVRETGSALFDYTIFNNNGALEFSL